MQAGLLQRNAAVLLKASEELEKAFEAPEWDMHTASMSRLI
jgi:hypothetical protein